MYIIGVEFEKLGEKVSLSFKDHWVAIIGTNGCGKTMLLNAMYSLLSDNIAHKSNALVKNLIVHISNGFDITTRLSDNNRFLHCAFIHEDALVENEISRAGAALARMKYDAYDEQEAIAGIDAQLANSELIKGKLRKFKLLSDKFSNMTAGMKELIIGYDSVMLEQDGKKSPISRASSGESRYLMIMIKALELELYGGGVLLVDNIERSIHISVQRKVINDTNEIAPNVQLIFTTHSPGILSNPNNSLREDNIVELS